jgi:hypothetical protein
MPGRAGGRLEAAAGARLPGATVRDGAEAPPHPAPYEPYEPYAPYAAHRRRPGAAR